MKAWLRRLTCRWLDLVPSEFCAEYGERMWEAATGVAAGYCQKFREDASVPSGPIGDGIIEAFALCEAAIRGEKLGTKPALTKYFPPEIRVEEQKRWTEAHK